VPERNSNQDLPVDGNPVEYGPTKRVLVPLIAIATFVSQQDIPQAWRVGAGALAAGATALYLYLIRPPSPGK
jgi:hypothetical protein